MVDLGYRYDICEVILHWEDAYASNFQVQVSDDTLNWTALESITGNSAVNDTFFLSGTGRYLRIYGTKRATPFGYSLWEVQAYGTLASSCAVPTGLSAGSIGQNQVTLHWTPSGAPSYIVQYKTTVASNWTQVSTALDSLNLDNLSCGTDYYFRVQAICSSGDSSYFSGQAAFSLAACTNTGCGPLPTRWSSTDLGNIGQAGESCYNNGIFTLEGSGEQIGGTSDAFQFAYRTLTSDGDYYVRVSDLDQTDPDEMGGIMIRDSLSPGSRMLFLGLNAGAGAEFIYRTTPYGMASQNILSGISPPYWVKLSKTGTQYSGFISQDGNTWTQIGPSLDAGFGLNPVLVGLSMTSDDNNDLAGGTMDNSNFSEVLSVNLMDFTAREYKNQRVELDWSTARETRNDHFVIERSTDGHKFRPILEVLSQNGNSRDPQYYSAYDEWPVHGVNYYRLQEVDRDGQYSFSRVISVVFPDIAPVLLYPDPVGNILYLTLQGEQLRYLRVYDMQGRTVLEQVGNAPAQTLELNTSGLVPGAYVIEMVTQNHTYRKTFVRQ